MEATEKELKAILAEVSDLNRASMVLAWDQETNMPPGGVESRGQQSAALRKLAHERFTGDQVGRLLDQLEPRVEAAPFDSDQASLVRVTRREYEKQRKVPPEHVAESARCAAHAHPAWVKARKDNDFGHFAPYLKRNVELSKKLAEYMGYDKHPYDALSDRTEPGLTTEQLDRLFGELKAAIVPLVKQIAGNRDAVDDRCLFGDFDPEKQLEYTHQLTARLGYDYQRGRQDLSPHPFSVAFGPGDVRITTRVRRDWLPYCLFSSIHECGHALYNQGISRDLDRTPLWGGSSPGIHESQSRLWENLVGRSLPFWKHFFPELARRFPSLKKADAEAFFKAVNKVQPSLIRTEADEVTYNLHIVVRYELENELLEDRLRVEDLPAAWNARMKAYLGVAPPNDTEGCLQDIHWSGSAFGGFHGYTLGNVAGAQLMEKIRRDLPDLDRQVEAGEFQTLLGWLRDNVYRHGRKFTPNELLERVTGRPLVAGPWIAYVRGKFSALYGLKEAAARQL